MAQVSTLRLSLSEVPWCEYRACISGSCGGLDIPDRWLTLAALGLCRAAFKQLCLSPGHMALSEGLKGPFNVYMGHLLGRCGSQD